MLFLFGNSWIGWIGNFLITCQWCIFHEWPLHPDWHTITLKKKKNSAFPQISSGLDSSFASSQCSPLRHCKSQNFCKCLLYSEQERSATDSSKLSKNFSDKWKRKLAKLAPGKDPATTFNMEIHKFLESTPKSSGFYALIWNYPFLSFLGINCGWAANSPIGSFIFMRRALSTCSINLD